MANSCRLPITCALTGDNYVVQVEIGSAAVAANLVVDSGSSTAAVNAALYDPGQDTNAVTGVLAQNRSYLSAGTMLGAVVQTTLTVAPSSGASVAFAGTNLAVNYATGPNVFGLAHGILGLAFAPGNPAATMPANSWQTKYPARQVDAATSQPIAPFLDQAAAAGTLDRAFALCVTRSLASQASPAANNGILVLGADAAGCADLYQGTLSYAQLTSAAQYNTNLLSVQVGNQPAIPVPPPPSWNTAAASNSIVDSGTASLILSSTLYPQILAAFNAINPAFGDALSQYASGTGSCDQTTLDLGAWPSIALTLQGGATITIAAQDYWQFDAQGAGRAVAMLVNDSQGQLGGMSVLGLPLFAGNFVLFDRASAGEPGTNRVRPAPITPYLLFIYSIRAQRSSSDRPALL